MKKLKSQGQMLVGADRPSDKTKPPLTMEVESCSLRRREPLLDDLIDACECWQNNTCSADALQEQWHQADRPTETEHTNPVRCTLPGSTWHLEVCQCRHTTKLPQGLSSTADRSDHVMPQQPEVELPMSAVRVMRRVRKGARPVQHTSGKQHIHNCHM